MTFYRRTFSLALLNKIVVPAACTHRNDILFQGYQMKQKCMKNVNLALKLNQILKKISKVRLYKITSKQCRNSCRVSEHEILRTHSVVKKAFCLPKIVLTFHCLNKIVLVISTILQILGLQPRISKVFLNRQNNFFSQQVTEQFW